MTLSNCGMKRRCLLKVPGGQFIADYHLYPLFANSGRSEAAYPEYHADWVQALEYEELSPFHE
jgi:hypothetical protein